VPLRILECLLATADAAALAKFVDTRFRFICTSTWGKGPACHYARSAPERSGVGGLGEGRDILFAPVNPLPEVRDAAHFRGRGMMMTDPRGWDHISSPIRFAHEPGRLRLDSPAPGQQSHAILRPRGYAEDEIARLQARGVNDATPEAIARHASAGRARNRVGADRRTEPWRASR
jgi:hypothetical protein